jgi:predicted amidohydrolase
MKISLIQSDIAWEDPKSNHRAFGAMIDSVKDHPDIIMLPEMFNTGFSLNSSSLAEEMTGESVSWLRKTAMNANTAVCCSLIIRERNTMFNRFLFITPDGKDYHYDKRHLFSISGEDLNFTKGNERIVFEYLGFRILPLICYDLRFPVWIRNRNDYDLILLVANWPEPRISVWNTLIKARAIENQCYVAAVNRTGTDPEGNNYPGNSIVCDPKGNVITGLQPHEKGIATTDISIDSLREFRNKFPVWRDADNFNIT